MKEGEIGGKRSTLGIDGSAYKILVGKPERKKPIWRPVCRWNLIGIVTGFNCLRIGTSGRLL
jgi:hypothetical protein